MDMDPSATVRRIALDAGQALDTGLALDAGLALAVIALELSDLFAFHSGDHPDALTVVLLLASAGPLVAWRRWPFATLQLTGWATIALAARHSSHLGLGPIAATYAVASWGGTPARRAAAGTLLIAVWLVPLLTGDQSAIPTNAALFAASFILGALMRDRRIKNATLHARNVELAHEREENAALAAEQERARIARELHDVLTHSVSVMVIQAQAAQASLDHDRMTIALNRIETIGREALAELRGLLRQARSADEFASRGPQPGLERLEDLIDAVRATGAQISLAREGAVRSVPASVELSAYRIVQEALTNTIRHTPGASARVALRYLPGELAVEVLDDGCAVGDKRRGDGRGIAGMRERAASVGGTLVAESCPEGGFRVAARLPLRTGP